MKIPLQCPASPAASCVNRAHARFPRPGLRRTAPRLCDASREDSIPLAPSPPSGANVPKCAATSVVRPHAQRGSRGLWRAWCAWRRIRTGAPDASPLAAMGRHERIWLCSGTGAQRRAPRSRRPRKPAERPGGSPAVRFEPWVSWGQMRCPEMVPAHVDQWLTAPVGNGTQTKENIRRILV